MINQVTLLENRPYTISTALDKSFVLDCSQNDDLNKKYSACLWKRSNDLNQKFKVFRHHDNFYEIVELKSNQVMQVKDSKINNGARIIFGPKRNQYNEWWQLIPVRKTNE